MKVNLPEVFIHNGIFYGPGVVDVDDAIGTDLQAATKRRMASLKEPPGNLVSAKPKFVTPVPVVPVEAEAEVEVDDSVEAEADTKTDDEEVNVNYSLLKLSRLRRLANERDIADFDKMPKSELVEALEAHDKEGH